MAKLVNIAEEDVGYDLIALLEHLKNPKVALPTEKDPDEENKQEDETTAKSLFGDTAFGKLIAGKKYLEFLEKCFVPSLDIVLKASAQDIDTAFSLCFFIVQTNLNSQSSAKILPALVQSLSKDSSSHSDLKLRLLTVAFNLTVDNAALRFSFFVSLVKFALASGKSAALAAQVNEIESWIPNWNLKGAESAELYLLLANVVESTGKRGPRQKYLLKYVKALEKSEVKSDKAATSATKPNVIAAMVNAVQNGHRSAMIHTDKLLSSTVVKALSNEDKDVAALLQLLRIFAGDTVDAYLKWASANGDIMSKYKLNQEQTLSKIRTLTLCGLGLTQERIPLELLKEKLAFRDVAAVESAVIDAVVSGLISAKVDQENEVVVVQRATQRSFDTNDWKTLHDKLASWQTNVNQVLSTLHTAQDRLRPQAFEDEEEAEV